MKPADDQPAVDCPSACTSCRDPFEGTEILVVERPVGGNKPNGLSHLFCFVLDVKNKRRMDQEEHAVIVLSGSATDHTEADRVSQAMAEAECRSVLDVVKLAETNEDIMRVAKDQADRVKFRRSLNTPTRAREGAEIESRCAFCKKLYQASDILLSTAPPDWQPTPKIRDPRDRTAGRRSSDDSLTDPEIQTGHFVCTMTQSGARVLVGGGVQAKLEGRQPTGEAMLLTRDLVAWLEDSGSVKAMLTRPASFRHRYPRLARVASAQARRLKIRWPY